MTRALERSVNSVVRNANCSGCGACALMSDRVSMHLDDTGYMRPHIDNQTPTNAATDRQEASLFDRVCPGRRLQAEAPLDRKQHETFGAYVSSWRAHAIDNDVRHSGSSAGVLTALSQHLVETSGATGVVAAGPSMAAPTRTVPVRIQTRDEALAASGSRYAPTSTLVGYSESNSTDALVAKPCEVAAMRRLNREKGQRDTEMPMMLSFFCAGTPSQTASNDLITSLGMSPDAVTSLRYRGLGWPGDFVASDGSTEVSVTYDESWGKHLGRQLQWRCKTCPDGTGEASDVAVGDFWKADDRGYPLFDDAAGSSVAIARTERGHALLMEAAREGRVALEPVDLDEVARIQPLQVNRRRTVAVRLLAQILTFRKIPRYQGFALTKQAAGFPKLSLRTFVGTLQRSWKDRLKKAS
ncbi:Coenzyme F420 hydrogenase/dehydrogenase, beta subunit C-terminal domain [Mycetocola zhadangensis]|uniref:Coenzyme F420 hydrogenase/dehydrogenase, beta subunit C-terminal domain n=1 Tax=Mycetocola zhadangensis TaxID=1164595 RepID=UPI003A4DD38B